MRSLAATSGDIVVVDLQGPIVRSCAAQVAPGDRLVRCSPRTAFTSSRSFDPRAVERPLRSGREGATGGGRVTQMSVARPLLAPTAARRTGPAVSQPLGGEYERRSTLLTSCRSRRRPASSPGLLIDTYDRLGLDAIARCLGCGRTATGRGRSRSDGAQAAGATCRRPAGGIPDSGVGLTQFFVDYGTRRAPRRYRWPTGRR